VLHVKRLGIITAGSRLITNASLRARLSRIFKGVLMCHTSDLHVEETQMVPLVYLTLISQ